MHYQLINHVYSLLGFLSYTLILLWQFKNKKDRKETKLTWKRYWQTHWDDYGVMLVIGQILTAIQELGASAYAVWFLDDAEDFWNKYYDSEEIIAFTVGALGVYILTKFFNFTKKTVDNNL